MLVSARTPSQDFKLQLTLGWSAAQATDSHERNHHCSSRVPAKLNLGVQFFEVAVDAFIFFLKKKLPTHTSPI